MADSSSFFNIYNTEQSKPRRYPWFIALIRMLFAILIMTLITNLSIVMFWPDGLQLLKNTYHQEVQYLSENIDERSTDLISQWVNQAYDYLFIKTGFQGYIYSGGSQITSSIISGIWPLLQGAMIGFQIFMIRLSVIILMLPFLLLIMAVTASDGYLEWYLRRTSGARESAFIYHRAKRLLSWSLIGLWFFYLMPPFAIDPIYIFVPAIFLIGIFTRISIQFFKKYV